MKKTLIQICCLSALLACDFNDTNIDPTRRMDVDVDLIMPSLQAQTARNQGSIGARVTGSIIQQFKGIDAQPEAYNTYTLDENVLDTYWRTGLYVGAMKDASIIIAKGNEKNTPHHSGVAKILMAYNLGIATSFWGDVPYSEAFDELNEKASYDSQEQIYAAIQDLLDDAISDLNLPPGDIPLGKEDLIYKGKVALWVGTARALKARFYMHLVKRDPKAASKALAVLNKGTIFSNEIQPVFSFGAEQNAANPIAYFAEDRKEQLALGDHLVEMLDADNDPRKGKYGVFSGGNYLLYKKDNENLYFGQFNSPMPLITYSEVLFIKSEANLRLGNFVAADNFFFQAVTANMEMLGVTPVNPIGTLSSLPTFEEQLEKLINQKYIAMFGHGTLEAWVDYKRTGYPQLTPNTNANQSFNPSKVIPRRFIYPISERTANRTNMEQAIDNQGGHLLDVDTWAFKNQ